MHVTSHHPSNVRIHDRMSLTVVKHGDGARGVITNAGQCE